jgi:fumarate hydratase class II
MIAAYATLKKAAANANHTGGRLDGQLHRLIAQVCDEILAGQHQDMPYLSERCGATERFELSNTCF